MKLLKWSLAHRPAQKFPINSQLLQPVPFLYQSANSLEYLQYKEQHVRKARKPNEKKQPIATATTQKISPKPPMQNLSFNCILVSLVKFREFFPESLKLLVRLLGKKGLLASSSALGRTFPWQEQLNAKLVGQSKAGLFCLKASRPFPLRAFWRNNNGLLFRAVA